MQYQVPQFIEIEDKIFGPLTFKQFVYVVGGTALCYFAYRFLPIYIAIFFIIPVGGISLALAFYKVNRRPFVFALESAVRFLMGKKLYIWQKSEPKPGDLAKKEDSESTKISIPKLSNSKLRDLTWSLDINETIYSKETGFKSRNEIHPQEEGLASFKGLKTDIQKSNINYN
jgi:PrgI family protein